MPADPFWRVICNLFHSCTVTAREDTILSEFYHLRRTSIKDLAAYCGFLIGFLGSAPVAWQYLAAEIDGDDFVRGLWYFFGFVIGAALITGFIGLAAGTMIGWSWEQYHRNRRRRRSRQRVPMPVQHPPEPDYSSAIRLHSEAAESPGPDPREPPRLQLLSPSINVVPSLLRKRLTSVKFLVRTIELDFSGVVVRVTGNPLISAGTEHFRYPEAGAREALCGMIGTTVNRQRTNDAGEVELGLDSSYQLLIPRNAAAVA